MKKTVAVILALVLCLGCLAGCSTDKDAVMSVEGVNVSWDEFMYYLYSASSTLESYYSSSTGSAVDWDGACIYDKSITNAEWCIQEALFNAAQGCLIVSKGKAMNASPTEEQLAEIDSNIESIKENYSESDDPDAAFAEALNEQGLTLATFKSLSQINYILNNMFTATYGETGEKVSDEVLNKYIENNGYMTSAHILFLNYETVEDEDGNTTQEELSDDELAAKKANAEKLCKELQAIEDDTERSERFFELMDEYSEAPGKTSYPNGYCFTEGTMVEEYTTTTQALKNYEVSDVVESDYGYHIIMRVPTVYSDVDISNSYGYTLGQMAASEEFDSSMDSWDINSYAKFSLSYQSFDFTQFFDDDGFHFTPWTEYSAK